MGNKIPCARCQTPSTVYPTVFYVEKVLERYTAALRELKVLKELQKPPETPQLTASPSLSQLSKKTEKKAKPPLLSSSVNIYNTALLATSEQHAPLKKWFESRQTKANFDYSAVDTSGFFDDAAAKIGDNYALLSGVMSKVREAYRQHYSNVTLELIDLSQKDAGMVHNFCRLLHQHSLFAHYHYQKAGKIGRITLQLTQVVRQFFNGEWLEWFVFTKLLQESKKLKNNFSVARGVKIVFPNEDLHELDVVYLPQGKSIPIIVECKSGEFRSDIEKYLRLCKRLGIDKQHFILCASELTTEQAKGLSAMYEISFVNLMMLEGKLGEVLML